MVLKKITVFIWNSDYTIDLPEVAHCLQAKIKRMELNNTVIPYATWVHRQASSFSSFSSKQVGFIKINCQQYPSKYCCKLENSRPFLYINLLIQTSLKDHWSQAVFCVIMIIYIDDLNC